MSKYTRKKPNKIDEKDEFVSFWERAFIKVAPYARAVGSVDPPGGFFGLMPALAEGLGVKIVTFYPPNAERGIPTHGDNLSGRSWNGRATRGNGWKTDHGTANRGGFGRRHEASRIAGCKNPRPSRKRRASAKSCRSAAIGQELLGDSRLESHTGERGTSRERR